MMIGDGLLSTISVFDMRFLSHVVLFLESFDLSTHLSNIDCGRFSDFDTLHLSVLFLIDKIFIIFECLFECFFTYFFKHKTSLFN